MMLADLVGAVAVPFDHLLDFEAFERRDPAGAGAFFDDLAVTSLFYAGRETAFVMALRRAIAARWAWLSGMETRWSDPTRGETGMHAGVHVSQLGVHVLLILLDPEGDSEASHWFSLDDYNDPVTRRVREFDLMATAMEEYEDAFEETYNEIVLGDDGG